MQRNVWQEETLWIFDAWSEALFPFLADRRQYSVGDSSKPVWLPPNRRTRKMISCPIFNRWGKNYWKTSHTDGLKTSQFNAMFSQGDFRGILAAKYHWASFEFRDNINESFQCETQQNHLLNLPLNQLKILFIVCHQIYETLIFSNRSVGVNIPGIISRICGLPPNKTFHKVYLFYQSSRRNIVYFKQKPSKRSFRLL